MRWARLERVLLAVVFAPLLLRCSDDATPPPDERPQPLVDPKKVMKEFEMVVPCRPSHEHELRHVVSFADPISARIFEDCVLSTDPEACKHAGFPEGSLFVKFEFEHAACFLEDLVSYTVTQRLADGSYAKGRDWRWQRLSPELEVEQDGAPSACLTCHIEHCSPPNGFDMHCRPD